ncbi:putative Heterokaryon incompatibility domain-containing protein [Seiridium cardinale]
MRLINTHTYFLLEPWKAADKEYAILSHTWGAEEVTFQEWEQLFPSGAIKGQCPHVRHTGIEERSGYRKVIQACEQARRDGIRWLWCDTMCINKESSAELSEAINSMFKWYSHAAVCYVYLTDVIFPDQSSHLGIFAGQSNVRGWFQRVEQRIQEAKNTPTETFVGLASHIKNEFSKSRWWTRGWTLQELLAPQRVVFFSLDWTPLGQKADLADRIAKSTKIHRRVLEDRSTMSLFSVAQRMSWAANRQTTVIEDMAYCLLGIFDINMPMLYGEGQGAFKKLQEEIIRVSDDQSIFAWSLFEPQAPDLTGALAASPASFRDSGSIIYDRNFYRSPFSRTNLGFKVIAPMISNPVSGTSFVGLNCVIRYGLPSD